MQAIVLVGGKGTRLRPLTERVPKPALTLVDRPFLAYMIEWLAGHGVTEVVLACGFLPDVLREALADEEERAGARIRYAVESEPLGTAGAIRFAADSLGDELEDRFLALNGDVLTDLDLSALLRAHEQWGAAATIGLHPVEDSSAFGLVQSDEEGKVLEFLEKTGEREPGEVNAGMYVLERGVFDLIPPGESVSIERDVFPRLVGEGLHGLLLEGHWVDIGTPERYLQASWDILEGRVATRVEPTSPRVLVDPSAAVDTGASVGPRAVIGPACRVGAGAEVVDSVLLDGCVVGKNARVAGSVLSPGTEVAAGAVVEGVVAGEGERLPARSMLEDVLAIPDHLRDALFRVESARLPRSESAGLLICGMGGSAIGGDLAAAALGDRLARPVLTVRGYALPSWATPEWTVFCSSYSGETEETLACFAAAEALGARRVVAGTGGALVDSARSAGDPVIGLPGLLPAPRTAVAYMLVCAAEVAAAAGVAPSIATEIEAAAAFLEGERDELRHRAGEIAAALGERIPVFYGAGPTVAAARRWKAQVNENAKLPAFRAELPEANHNEICIWEAPSAAGLAAVLLEDRDQHPREQLRFDLTAAEVERDGGVAVRVEAAGESPTARLLWTVMLGDLVSLELAEARGVDPLPIEAIDRLKTSLSG